MVLPASAVHNGHVFVLDADSRLRQRPVEVAILQGDLAVISDGLQENELVVLSDLSPAIDGMLIDPVHDHALPARLRDQAVGEEARP
ncbi:MAG: efflux transporter periplasmic adaptor subunit, partial [Lentisphaerae bacterium]|jgi:multidrug efflux pump subunit AcrA (membrane-fusion protein)|nr:efflux transporter periplasmic adaptor subunit [Lentisphaerota bacterium]